VPRSTVGTQRENGLVASIDELVTGLRAILRQVETSRARLHDAAANWDAASATYSATLRGSHSLAAADLTRIDAVARRRGREAMQTVDQSAVRIETLIRRYQGGTTSADRPESTPRQEPTSQPRRSPNVRHQDGSEYPPEADWAVATLPTRVGIAGQRTTTGRVKIGDRVIPGEFRSGEWDSWVDRAWARFKEVGKADRAGAFLKFHVESRVIAMMIETGQRQAEVVINNVVCGYQSKPPGCHQRIEDLLPPDWELRVLGTDIKGRPFSRLYRGRST
jgi:hypothetical protein